MRIDCNRINLNSFHPHYIFKLFTECCLYSCKLNFTEKILMQHFDMEIESRDNKDPYFTTLHLVMLHD